MEERLDKLETMSETSTEIAGTWSSSHEGLLAGIADRANCYRWMHNRCQTIYEKYNFYLTVPSIVVSALAGSATIASTALFAPEYQQLASTLIGLATLGTGILTSINQYMKSAQFAETHRSTSLAYGKLHTIIASELSMRRDQRLNALEFIKVIRSEQDRLQENSPIVLDSVVSQFRKEFKDVKDLEKPEIAGDLDHVRINSTSKLQVPLLRQVPMSPDFDRSKIHSQLSYNRRLSELAIGETPNQQRHMTTVPLMSTLTTLSYQHSGMQSHE